MDPFDPDHFRPSGIIPPLCLLSILEHPPIRVGGADDHRVDTKLRQVLGKSLAPECPTMLNGRESVDQEEDLHAVVSAV
jgi:hypothetical protein